MQTSNEEMISIARSKEIYDAGLELAIKQEIEKRLTPGFFRVTVREEGLDYRIIITDGVSSASYVYPYFRLGTEGMQGHLDRIAYNLVHLFADERFLRIDNP